MEKEILSLKNIYRLLVVRDYPVYSPGVISERGKKGLTLVKFWQKYLIYEFRSGTYGRMIWRMEGSRNRHITSICNRTGNLSTYLNYEKEVLSMLNEQSVSQQIASFYDFIRTRGIDFQALIKKLSIFLSLVLASDSEMTEEAGKCLKTALEKAERAEIQKKGIQEFYASWLLTLFTLFALTASRTGNERLSVLLNRGDFTAEALYRVHQQQKEEECSEIQCLTKQTGELCREPLPKQHFFGREEELFELQQKVREGGHYLISGMGGIGKTELMRQLYRNVQEERMCHAVCLIQYEKSIADSFAYAFPGLDGGNLQRNFQEALGRICQMKDKKVLVLIDNMNQSMEEDSGLKELCRLPATILMTSRLGRLDGFTTISIHAPEKTARKLIFRDQYRLSMSKEERELLDRLLDQDIWCHTLTLRFMGRAAHMWKWTISEMKHQFEQDKGKISWSEDNGVMQLQQMYQRMYRMSKINDGERSLLQIFSLLPYASYNETFLETYFGESLEDRSLLRGYLQKLCDFGWLEPSDRGFSMHPFLAECVASKLAPDTDYSAFYDQVDCEVCKVLGLTDITALHRKLHWEILQQHPEVAELERTFLLFAMKQNIVYNERQILQILAAAEAVMAFYGMDGLTGALGSRLRSRIEEFPKMSDV